MGNFINVECQIQEVQKALEGTNKSLKTISKKTLSVIGKGALKALKGGIQNTLNRRTGALLKAYVYKGNKSGTSGNVRIDPKIPNGDDMFRKVYVLNYGYTGEVHRAWNKPHSFVQCADDYIQNGSYGAEIDKMVQKELDKYWE